MTKIAVRIAMTSLLILSLLSGCTNSEIVSCERITVENEIAYAYITTEPNTNVYGGILGYDRYIYYGEIENGEMIADDIATYENIDLVADTIENKFDHIIDRMHEMQESE